MGEIVARKHPRDMGPREVEAFLTMLAQTLKIGNSWSGTGPVDLAHGCKPPPSGAVTSKLLAKMIDEAVAAPVRYRM